jgi:hypothetical protein
MFEVLAESVRLVNLPFTILLAGVVLYWLCVGLGFLHCGEGAHDVGVDAHGDFHADGHADVHADGHVDAGGHAESAHGHGDLSHGWLTSALKFLNVGEVPAMIILSILILCTWISSMVSNHYWNDQSLMRALAFFVPNLVVSAIVTRYVTFPLKKFFTALNREYDEHQALIGRSGTVVTSEVNKEFGQVEITTKGSPLLLNARTLDDQILKKGESCFVVKEDAARNLHFVVKVSSDKLED